MVDLSMIRARRSAHPRTPLSLKRHIADDVSLATAIACVVIAIAGHLHGAW